ncbi:hypothetical protein [Nocardioides sp. SYSU D00038]|uniref:hypothetical protein n=1 Tax=Nocardioides sp. SYSU D00038 TaxID=2812554 RepID=UPI001F081DE2|nr:hypothetical protein [Nocardioides sp. SYSU D00038]
MSGPLDQISVVAIGYGVLVTLAAAYSLYRWRARPPWLSQLVWMLEFLLGLRAVAGLGSLLAGNRPDEPVTYVGYLVVSVATLPLALRSVDGDESGWAVGVLGVAALAVTVVAWRTLVTG